MELGVKESSEGKFHSQVVLDSFVGCGLKRGEDDFVEGDFLEVFCKSDGDHHLAPIDE